MRSPILEDDLTSNTWHQPHSRSDSDVRVNSVNIEIDAFGGMNWLVSDGGAHSTAMFSLTLPRRHTLINTLRQPTAQWPTAPFHNCANKLCRHFKCSYQNGSCLHHICRQWGTAFKDFSPSSRWRGSDSEKLIKLQTGQAQWRCPSASNLCPSSYGQCQSTSLGTLLH